MNGTKLLYRRVPNPSPFVVADQTKPPKAKAKAKANAKGKPKKDEAATATEDEEKQKKEEAGPKKIPPEWMLHVVQNNEVMVFTVHVLRVSGVTA